MFKKHQSLQSIVWILGSLTLNQANASEVGNFRTKVSSFPDLWNQVSQGQADPTPWTGSYFAYGTDGIAEKLKDGKSPAEKFDQWMGNPSGQSAQAWELDEHSCRKYKGETKTSCESWWGHCNAWSAAAIKEVEPVKAISSKGIPFGVGDQKALLTEIWMESGALFAGDTDKSTKVDGTWIADPSDRRSKKVTGWGGKTVYDAFWDVTPRAFFLIMTNYVGLNQQGVVIDRFTGDEVWNHPIIGYKFLPIRTEDMSEVSQDGKTLYALSLRVKMFWGEDGVPADHLSKKFAISNIGDTESIENFHPDFSGRLLKFKLYFDAPVEIKAGKVVSAGRITGPGLWAHQENPHGDLNATHPDFIWQPVDLNMGAASGSRNAFVGPEEVYQILKAEDDNRPAPNSNSSRGRLDEFELVNLSIDIRTLKLRTSPSDENFPNRVKAKLMRIFKRANIVATIDENKIKVKTRIVKVPVEFFGRNGTATLTRVLEESGIL